MSPEQVRADPLAIDTHSVVLVDVVAIWTTTTE
jgi:hypothetical protein